MNIFWGNYTEKTTGEGWLMQIFLIILEHLYPFF